MRAAGQKGLPGARLRWIACERKHFQVFRRLLRRPRIEGRCEPSKVWFAACQAKPPVRERRCTLESRGGSDKKTRTQKTRGIPAGISRPRAATRGLIAAPWTLASLCCRRANADATLRKENQPLLVAAVLGARRATLPRRFLEKLQTGLDRFGFIEGARAGSPAALIHFEGAFANENATTHF